MTGRRIAARRPSSTSSGRTLSALMPYRVAAGVLEHFLPVDAGISHETLRGRTLKLGEEAAGRRRGRTGSGRPGDHPDA